MTGYRQRVIPIAVYDARGNFICETEGVHIEEQRTRAAARIRERKRKEKMIRQKIALVIAIVTVSIILAAFMPWRGTADAPASYRQVKQDASAGAGEEVRQMTTVILPSSGTAAGYIPDAAEVEALAKMLYGEARGIPSDTEKAACVWVVLNRVDDPRFPDTVLEVLEAPYQFAGYSKDYPVLPELEALAADVLKRYNAERSGQADAGRVLPAEYCWFTGDGEHNYFTSEWKSTDCFGWTLESPYEN